MCRNRCATSQCTDKPIGHGAHEARRDQAWFQRHHVQLDRAPVLLTGIPLQRPVSPPHDIHWRAQRLEVELGPGAQQARAGRRRPSSASRQRPSIRRPERAGPIRHRYLRRTAAVPRPVDVRFREHQAWDAPLTGALVLVVGGRLICLRKDVPVVLAEQEHVYVRCVNAVHACFTAGNGLGRDLLEHDGLVPDRLDQGGERVALRLEPTPDAADEHLHATSVPRPNDTVVWPEQTRIHSLPADRSTGRGVTQAKRGARRWRTDPQPVAVWSCGGQGN